MIMMVCADLQNTILVIVILIEKEKKKPKIIFVSSRFYFQEISKVFLFFLLIYFLNKKKKLLQLQQKLLMVKFFFSYHLYHSLKSIYSKSKREFQLSIIKKKYRLINFKIFLFFYYLFILKILLLLLWCLFFCCWSVKLSIYFFNMKKTNSKINRMKPRKIFIILSNFFYYFIVCFFFFLERAIKFNLRWNKKKKENWNWLFYKRIVEALFDVFGGFFLIHWLN